MELIDEAIRRLLEERKSRGASGESFFQGEDNKDDHLLLSRLLSQVSVTDLTFKFLIALFPFNEYLSSTCVYRYGELKLFDFLV